MPPRIPRIPRLGGHRMPIRSKFQQTCPFCTHFPRLQSPPSTTRSDPRAELRESLLELQKHASSFVNTSRLQLALRGLEQQPGEEIVRVAVLGIADGGRSLRKAKELLRLLLADPLKPEEEWERILLEDQQDGKPLLLKVGHNGEEEGSSGGRLVRELHVSSPGLNGHKLEVLVLEMNPLVENDVKSFREAALVPTMQIPTSATGRYTPVTTPVHRSLVVADGILGAASLIAYPIDQDRDTVGTVADIKVGTEEEHMSLPFPVVNIAQGTAALASFRETVNNALSYERDWFASGVPHILDWLKLGTAPTDGSTKPSVQTLDESIISDSAALLQSEHASRLSAALSDQVTAADLESLRGVLSLWSEEAHTELRDQLDIAFQGQRWRKLGWWKLFWRVDDVSMIAGDMLNQRFLVDSEKSIIYLTGMMAQAKVLREAAPENWAYKPVEEPSREPKLGQELPYPRVQDLIESKDFEVTKVKMKPWPIHIPTTRAYLSQETVPALQALAQKLVLQTLTTSSFASILGGLIYVSTISTGIYEAGVVAALGVVWSLRRMQGKWEAAREFWEGEVREEGRKAVRTVEGNVGRVLAHQPSMEADPELERVKEAIKRAESALKKCK